MMNTKFDTKILNNGFTVKSLKNEHLHSVNVGIYIKKEPESVCGIAHMTEHMFFRRLSDFPQSRLYFETDKIGATFKAATYADFIVFDITSSPLKVIPALNLIFKIFDDFEWSAEEVAAEKEVVKRQIEEKYNSLYNKADANFYKGTPKGSPLMGTLSDVQKMSVKRIRDYKKGCFVPDNCCVVMTGNFNEDDLNYCMDKLSKVPLCGKHTTQEFCIENFLNRSAESDKIYGSCDTFSNVSISFDVDEKNVNRYAAEILCSVLGYGVTSKLSQLLREQMGLISEIDAVTEFTSYSGRMLFEFEVSNSRLIDSLNAAFDILSNAKNELVKTDIDSNILFYTDNQYRLLDDVCELNFLIGWRSFIEDENLISIDNLKERYSNISISDLKRAAQQIFSPHNLVLTLTNNRKKFNKRKLVETINACRSRLEI